MVQILEGYKSSTQDVIPASIYTQESCKSMKDIDKNAV